MPNVFGTYRLEVEALLTWYPNQSTSTLKEARIRGGSFRHSTGEEIFEVGNAIVHMIGQGGNEELLAPNNYVVAFIEIGVDNDTYFEVECELVVGTSKRSKRLRILPDTRTPFMINLAAPANDEAFSGTAAVLQGVILATQLVGLGKLALDIAKASLRAG